MKEHWLKKVLVVIIVLLLLDYIDLPTSVGIDINRFNIDFSIAVLTSGIAVILFLQTYFTIDKVTKQKEENKQQIAVLLINDICREMEEVVNKVLIDKIVNDNILPKIDFNSYSESSIITNLKNMPFENENNLYDLLRDGQLPKDMFLNYLQLKQHYKSYITMRIIYFDAPEIYETLKRRLEQEISQLKSYQVLKIADHCIINLFEHVITKVFK